MERLFKLKEHGTNVRTEVIAGITTFFTMAYIVFVNPKILSATGMDWNGVLVATIFGAVVGTLVMAFVANVPYAVAPGMGLNAFFTYTVCFGLGFAWQEALAMVFICGLLNVFITVTKIRKAIIKSIPQGLQLAIGGGIGLFIAYIGIKDAGLLKFTSDPGTYTALPSGTVISDSSIIPGLVNFNKGAVLLALVGIILILVLMVLKVKGAILIGIITTTIIGVIATACGAQVGIAELPKFSELFSTSPFKGLDQTFGALFGNPGIGSLFSDASRIPMVIMAIFAFSLSDTFDTIGTFIGTGRKTGIFDAEDEKALESSSGFKSRMDRALFADSTATSIGALFGTSNTTTYVESAAGIEAGGRTGLTSVVTAVLFLLCLPLHNLIKVVPMAATAPALVVVGILMMAPFKDIAWAHLEEAIPAFFTVIIMVFSYNISYGIAFGFITYCLVKILLGKAKEVHPIIYGSTLLFVLNFVLLAIKDL